MGKKSGAFWGPSSTAHSEYQDSFSSVSLNLQCWPLQTNSPLCTSGTGFIAVCSKQRMEPLKTLFGWHPSNGTGQFWKIRSVCGFVWLYRFWRHDRLCPQVQYFPGQFYDEEAFCSQCFNHVKPVTNAISGGCAVYFFKLKLYLPDSCINGYMIGMATHSWPVKSQHLKQ